MAELGDTTVYGSFDARGIVSKPKQPAFSAILAANVYIAASITWYTMAPWTEYFDNGNNFNATTGIFTAPVSGRYQLCSNVDLRGLDTAAAYYWLNITTTNAAYGQLLDPNFTVDIAYRSFSVAILADMDAGDTADSRIYQNGGTVSQTWAQATYTGFSGFLAC